MTPGTIVPAKPDTVVGREQAGWRPVLIVSTTEYSRHIPDLVMVVPLSSRDRGLPHHIPVNGDETGLQQPTWALCEQLRAVSATRLGDPRGAADDETLARVRTTLKRFLGV